MEKQSSAPLGLNASAPLSVEIRISYQSRLLIRHRSRRSV
ncbi:hypothetical protein CKA32_006785 [Geitlerinema sp. FC II]|nr:hypothetical protein CKA32_006785 [Geitlerinema sp. FC II]